MKEFDSGESASIVSVTDKVRPLPLGAAVSSAYFLGDNACFVGTEEKIAVATPAGEISQIEVHFGAILCTASDGVRIVTGGDDGKLIALSAKGETSVLATDAKRRWIDCVALHPDGATSAWTARRSSAMLCSWSLPCLSRSMSRSICAVSVVGISSCFGI